MAPTSRRCGAAGAGRARSGLQPWHSGRVAAGQHAARPAWSGLQATPAAASAHSRPQRGAGPRARRKRRARGRDRRGTAASVATGGCAQGGAWCLRGAWSASSAWRCLLPVWLQGEPRCANLWPAESESVCRPARTPARASQSTACTSAACGGRCLLARADTK